MSGSLSALASAAGLSGASYLPAVFLGDLALGDFAIPEKIRSGTQQQFTVHKLPGGARVFDNMGPDPDLIEFSGIFLGPQAPVQLNQFATMRAAAKPITLAWGIYNFKVLIEHVRSETGFNKVEWSVSLLRVPAPPPDNPDDDDQNLGDGEKADTPAEKQQEGQAATGQARAAGGALPIPPVPPAGGASGAGSGFSGSAQPPAGTVPFTGSGQRDR